MQLGPFAVRLLHGARQRSMASPPITVLRRRFTCRWLGPMRALLEHCPAMLLLLQSSHQTNYAKALKRGEDTCRHPTRTGLPEHSIAAGNDEIGIVHPLSPKRSLGHFSSSASISWAPSMTLSGRRPIPQGSYLTHGRTRTSFVWTGPRSEPWAIALAELRIWPESAPNTTHSRRPQRGIIRSETAEFEGAQFCTESPRFSALRLRAYPNASHLISRTNSFQKD
ncbi:uncharacterized protein B0I36DRAFT_1386 [Microdochium trichocladiopsis]|uniref:Uncharacterized protein n=1 Tax=Microdochium trichocladiopsis TaxID=1682393 RepID=A0A9P8YGW3_9PEZI|nr:uncharacterized protein B0I36DRAFT_1386 [Microdochium trichocladiopsis]KAH7039708.1 hypothetical protein B0I36DRAFT_1386 [Microdochium trichocladiopsis]